MDYNNAISLLDQFQEFLRRLYENGTLNQTFVYHENGNLDQRIAFLESQRNAGNPTTIQVEQLQSTVAALMAQVEALQLRIDSWASAPDTGERFRLLEIEAAA